MSLFKHLYVLATEHESVSKTVISADDIFGRGQNVSTGPAGGFTVPTNLGPVVQALFPFSAALQAGAKVVTLKTNTTLPRVTANATAQWGSETSTVNDSALSFDSLNLTPRRVSASVAISSQLLAQAPELAESTVTQNVHQAIGHALDVGIFSGIGGTEPLGLLYVPGVSEAVTFGGAGTLAKACAFEKKIGDNFAEQGPLTWVSSTATRERWRQIQRWTGSSTALWSDDDTIIGRPALATPSIANADSRMIFGCFSLYQIVMFSGIEVIRDPFTLKKDGKVEFTFNLFCDGGPLQDAAFARSSDTAAA